MIDFLPALGRRRLTVTILLTSGFWLGGAGPPDEPVKPGTGLDYWAAVAEKDQFAPASDPDRRLTLRSEPALRWTNPVRKTDDGVLYLWTDRGRPEVAVSFWHSGTGDQKWIVHEFQTLSVAPLVGRHEGRVVWAPKVGVTPAPIPDAPPPAAGAAERLRQVRDLARQFKATLDNPAERSDLRLLTQPLYRYDSEGQHPDVRDGALFAFVHTTDPEVLLQIESRVPSGGGPPSWHYALARMSGFPLHAEHKGREVWRVDHVGGFADNTKPYWALGQTIRDR